MVIKKIKEIKDWYELNERRVSTFSLLTGFIVDALTLQEIDALRENLWIAGNIFIVGLCIVLLNREENSRGAKALNSSDNSRHFWLANILQFGFGALLGALFIFYFRSSTLSVTWPFLLILLLAIVANELYLKRYTRLTFQISFFYLALFSFAIFLMPLILGQISAPIFLLSGVISLISIWIFVLILKRFAWEKFRQSRIPLVRSIIIIFFTVNVLYFTNLIPPIPLALKDGGIYHAVTRNIAGEYLVTGERKGILDYFRLKNRVHWTSGETLYAYTAIFSPGSLNTQIVHEWQYKNEAGEWVTSTRIPLYLSGGRTGGFRTYTTKSSLSAGDWRVNVETPHGQLIGRVSFLVVPSAARPPLTTSVKK